jgi:hypothetical protein
MEVDTATDCTLSYEPIRQSGVLPTLDYVQPKSVISSASNTTSMPSAPVVIKDDQDDEAIPFSYIGHWPTQLPSPPPPKFDLSLIPPPAFLVHLKDLTWNKMISRLYSVEMQATHPGLESTADGPTPAPPEPTSEPLGCNSVPTKLECISEDEILVHLHYLGLVYYQ